MILVRSLVALGFLLLPLSASAQPMEEVRGAPSGSFDFYVLALSWSPGFCETTGTTSGRRQCSDGSGIGFVLHGLWPQSERGYPAFCSPSGRFVPRAVIEDTRGLFPDDNLARYEWRKHGTCSGESPRAYFRAAQRARDVIKIPEALTRPRSDSKVMPIEIERAFVEANPGLHPDMMSISCPRRIFQEIRICLTRDLRGFHQCPQVDREGCRAEEITIPAIR